NELINSEDFEQNLKGEVLADSLKYLDEWTRNAENYFRELKLVYKEQTEEEDLLEDEENTREGQTFGTSSFEKSTKDNITSNVKLRLSLLVDENNLDDLFYEPTFIPFDDIYSTLQGVLTNNIALQGEDLFEIYKNEIFKLINKKPYFQNLYNQLENIDDYKKAEFVQAFNLDRNTFIGTMIDIIPIEDPKTKEVTGYKTNITVQDLSNTGGKNNFIKNNWYFNFIKGFAN